MLKVRIIPTLLWKGVGLVKGKSFDSWRRVGPVLPTIKVFNRREVDELILLDITLHSSDLEPDWQAISDLSHDCAIPLTVGGGVKNIDYVQPLLRAGADKISLNTALFDKPYLATEIAKRYGVQCVVASIDVRSSGKNEWECYTRAGTFPTRRNVCDFAREAEDRGAGEILITSIERDGTMEGYDLALIEAVTQTVNVPVIASGGAGKYEHMVEAINKAGASAVAAASMFHFTEQTPAGAREALAAASIPVRSTWIDHA